MLPLLDLLAIPDVPHAELASERCLVLASPEGRRRFGVPTTLEREAVLVPDTFDEDDAKALGIALHADVMRAGERWKIVRSASTTRFLERADTEWVRSRAQAASVAEAADAARDGRSPSGGVLEAYRRSEARLAAAPSGSPDCSAMRAAEVAPAARLLASVLRNAPTALWADVPPGGLTVLSNHPVGTELPLMIEPGAVDAYVAAQTRLAEWAQGAGMGQIPEPARGILPKDTPGPGPRTFSLLVQRRSESPRFVLRVYDRAGALESYGTLEAGGFPHDATALSGGGLLGTASLSPAATKAEAAADPESPGFRLDALDVGTHEPLDASVREAIVLYARAKGFGSVVACVPDGLLKAIAPLIHDSRVDLDALGGALARRDVEEIPRGRTLVLRPAHPLQEEATRIDRRPLATEYRQAVQGAFGIEALLALHASYAAAFEENAFLQKVQSRLTQAFRLAASPNWSVPHAFLAILGELSSAERGALASGTPLVLSPSAHPASLDAVARYAAGNVAPIMDVVGAPRVRILRPLNALELLPTHLLADPRGVRLDGSLDLRTLVKRVSLKPTTLRIVHPDTGEVSSRTGNNLVLDRQFEPIDALGFLGTLTRQLARPSKGFDESLLFLWARERRFATTFALGDGLVVGPVALRERIGESTTPVRLADVPGIVLPPTGP